MDRIDRSLWPNHNLAIGRPDGSFELIGVGEDEDDCRIALAFAFWPQHLTRRALGAAPRSQPRPCELVRGQVPSKWPFVALEVHVEGNT